MLVKTRFAPSPTGLIHLGNARTALFSALFAAHHNGSFLLRIEDTDEERSKDIFTQSLQTDLSWLECHWQEGAEVGGDFKPYYQSQRGDIYERYYQELIDQKRAYPCFCTEEQLALSRKLQRSQGIAPRYAGTCRGLSEAEIQEKLNQGLKPTLRFQVPNGEQITFDDVVKGAQTFNANDIGDFIIRRSQGTSSFMFCNAIDDALMNVTHVLRGEDHLTNTPRQLAILRALGLREPQYGHISLITGSDGAPLSKRNGSRSIQDLRELGYLPLAVVNYLARLGHYYESNELMTFAQLAEYFSVDSLSKSSAGYDEQQLKYFQKLAVMKLDAHEFIQWMGSEKLQHVSDDQKEQFVALIQPNVLFPSDSNQWADIVFHRQFIWDEEKKSTVAAAGKDYWQHAHQLASDDHQQFFSDLKQVTGLKGKQLFMPIRLALTGELHGPEMGPLFQLLGKQEIALRFEWAMRLVNEYE